MSIENIPPGSDTKDAPWNQVDPKMVECANCGGTGFLHVEQKGEHGETEMEVDECKDCGGEGEFEEEEEW
jgi:DnaJ-class molecular chaperone